MQSIIKTLVVYCYILVTIKATVIEGDDPNRIEAHSYEYYQIIRDPEVFNNCELDEMLAYGLSGDAKTLGEKNEICPHISQNCCGKKDQARIWEYWHRDRKRQEYYHRAVLKLIKYFLGYGMEWYRIAAAVIDDYEDKVNGMKKPNNPTMNTTENKDTTKDSWFTKGLIVNANQYCYNAAKYIAKLDFNNEYKAQTYYRMINEKTEFMENARRSFYCIFCSVEGQRAVDTWVLGIANNMRYNMNFCQSIVHHTFRINYELYNTYNDYLKNLLKMTQCVTANGKNGTNQATGGSSNANFKSNSPPVQLTKEEKSMIENPLKNDNWFSFETCNKGKDYLGMTACIPYCTMFNLAKPKAALDFDMYALHNVYRKIAPYEEVFRSTRHNFYRDDMRLLKQDIKDNFSRSDRSKIFFKTIVQHIDVSEYMTNFIVGNNAINPMEVARGNPLPINYKSVPIIMFAMIGVVIGFVYRG